MEKIKGRDLDNWRVVLMIFIIAPSFVWVPVVARFFWRRLKKKCGNGHGEHLAPHVA